MSTLVRYWLLQLPGWAAAGIVLAALAHWAVLSERVAMFLFVVWAVKDVVFYPFVRTAYESGVRTGAERLIGARGVAREALAPRGYVHVKGELWCAEAEAPEASIPPGSRVRVRGTRGLTLIVAEDGDDERRGARWSNAS